MGLLTLVALATPRRAAACTILSPEYGLTVQRPPQERQIASDGVLAFDAFIIGEAPAVALARFSLTLTPEAGGSAITGEASLTPLGSEPYSAIDDYQEVVLVWRPAAPLVPGTYTADVTIQAEGEARMLSFPVVVVDAPAAPLSAPRVEGVETGVFDDAALERVCCEVSASSCGGGSVCEATRVRVVPGFTVSAALEPADIERAYLWIAPWDGEAGLPFERVNPWNRAPEVLPLYAQWTPFPEIRLPDAAGESCIVVGATSLIDGSTVLAEPICRELTAAHEEARTPMFPVSQGDLELGCLTPPVYEDDGSPYPPKSDSGCRLTATNPGPLVFLLLLVARRRRAVSGRR